MAIRRAMTMVVALVVVAMFAVSGVAAQQAQAKQDTKKRSKQEQQEIETVVKLVDGVMAGQPAPSDITMTLEPFFMKSQEQRTFVPFVLSVTNAPKTDAAMTTAMRYLYRLRAASGRSNGGFGGTGATPAESSQAWRGCGGICAGRF